MSQWSNRGGGAGDACLQVAVGDDEGGATQDVLAALACDVGFERGADLAALGRVDGPRVGEGQRGVVVAQAAVYARRAGVKLDGRWHERGRADWR